MSDGKYQSVLVDSDDFVVGPAVEAFLDDSMGGIFSPGKYRQAVGSALKRAGKSGLTFAAKAIQEQYKISVSNFKKYTWAKTRFKDTSYSSFLEIEYRGYHIPLISFDTSIDKKGRVIARVKQSSTKTLLDHVFRQSVGNHGHIGVFERKYDDKLPIEEKLGPSGPQMMYSNEAVMDSIVDKVTNAFNERIDHEVMAILNGWRKPKTIPITLDMWSDMNK